MPLRAPICSPPDTSAIYRTAARFCQVSANHLAFIARDTADRSDTQSLPFQFDDFVPDSPPEHIQASSAFRIVPTGRPHRVGEFSTGVMGIFAPALTLLSLIIAQRLESYCRSLRNLA
jgi:hypothetical protein